MDLDSAEALRCIAQANSDQQQAALPQTHWSASTGIPQNDDMGTNVNLGAFNTYTPDMIALPTDFTQQHASQSHQQPTWPNAGFPLTPNLVGFQPPEHYMDYAPSKESVIAVPTSLYANFGRPASQHSSQHAHSDFTQFPRQSVPPNFLQSTSSAGARRYTPKLIKISNPNSRGPQGNQHPPPDHPPPPPPKDEHGLSRMSMRGRHSNMSQHTVLSQRDLGGWRDELQWG